MKFIIASLTLMVFILIPACSKDDKKDEPTGSNSLIVGTWVRNSWTMTLGKDGSYYGTDNGSPAQIRRGRYSYNETTSLLIIDVDEIPGHNWAYTTTYYVQTLTQTTLAIIDMEYGDSEFYTRK